MKLKVIGSICFLLLVLIVSCQSDESIEFKRYYSAGSLVYQTHCQNCHGAKGEGLSALIPPLTDSIYIKQNLKSLACNIKFGLKGNIVVDGKSFEGAMPAANDLTPIEIAQAITYISNSFGSKQGTITVDQVNTDLSKCSN
jgi:mono/diheme cytochrome c family protein